ncbi:MBL fold metallo-hydrolase RNA specificity domain-containing protein [Breznakiella homolactica]|uniref:MBL fold metallo-hydrolase n=1 Tax=Breznakiella homolactica TaxID=2798577 RepID=A0A7T7XPY8_9SPIR|nr:MBL fold metallo-hydrolase [Breznakiella homolactica]QQO10243.1 MBL fold metallo-hydrolase [Breznakiella homolactica]
MAVTLYSLGAAEEVTGSKHIFEVNGKSYLVDCGAFQGKRAEADRKNRNFGIETDRIEAAILTHGHYDHSGMLPMLPKNGYKGNIFATSATRDIANLIMMDSANIQARDAVYLKKQAQKKGEIFDWEPLYNEKDAIQATNQIVGISYNRPMTIGDGITLEFYDAGHILGSAIAFVTIQDGDKEIKIAYTGDLGRKNKPIIRDPALIPAADYIVMESTYGDRRHDSTHDAMERLAEVAKRAIKNKGRILIPAFAIERTQELVYYFHMLVDQGIIPEIPIYVDSPMATNATTIFQVHPECYDEEIHEAFIKHHKNPFGFNSLHFTTSVNESKALNDHPGPLIIISADGMCEAGRIQHHLINSIEDPNTTVLTVGYMAQNTLGRRIRDKEPEVKIHGQWYKRNAAVEEINAFSAHADYTECKEWLDAIDTSRLKKIFLVHGEPKAQTAFKKYLGENGYSNTEVVRYGQTYETE